MMNLFLFELPTQGTATIFSILAVGFVLGLRHATEADHLAAVSTIVGERKSLWSSSLVGGLWGVGHTISLFVVGLIVIFLKLQISTKVETWLEACVGAMLILLGLNALKKMWRGEKIHVHKHAHEGREHLHIHAHARGKSEDLTHHKLSPRSVLVGMIHGLAGSAALMLLIIPTIESPLLAMAYILVFGIGSIGGMMLMSFLIGLPFHFTANRFTQLNTAIRLTAAVFSLGLGAFIIYEKTFA